MPLVLAAAFLVRAALALNTDLISHPDAIFQYLEQGHRLAFGYGVVPWEYVYGIRSWIVPGFIALILTVLSSIGLDSPLIYQPVVKLIFCGISLSLPLSTYRITQSLLEETSARVALIATAFWYEIVFYAHTPLADALGAYALFGALVYLLRPPARHSMIAFGALAGLTLALRYQLAPPVVVACAIAAARWRWSGWPAFAALFFVVILSGAFDAYTWGIWFGSVTNNLELNFFQDVAGQFSRPPPYFYLVTLAATSLGLAYVGCIGLLLSWRQTWPLSAVGFAALLAFSVVSHKEPRFIFLLVPVYLIGIAAFVTNRGLQTAVRSSVGARAIFLLAVPLAFVLAINTFVIGTIQRAQPNNLMSAYLMLSRCANVEGVIDESGLRWFLTGGYYYLHRNVPIYRPDMPATNITAARESPTRFATHWITRRDNAPSADYALHSRIGDVRVWERNHAFPNVEIAPGYAAHPPLPFESLKIVAPSPNLKARW